MDWDWTQRLRALLLENHPSLRLPHKIFLNSPLIVYAIGIQQLQLYIIRRMLVLSFDRIRQRRSGPQFAVTSVRNNFGFRKRSLE